MTERDLRRKPQVPFLFSPSRNLRIRVDGYTSHPFGRAVLAAYHRRDGTRRGDGG